MKCCDTSRRQQREEEVKWRRTIKVGSAHQAEIPECLCNYDNVQPYENEDKLLWSPNYLSGKDTEDFLVRAQGFSAGIHTRDDEQALYLLHQCGYDTEEALRRLRMNVVPPADTLSLWSEEERENFQEGLQHYGKDFHTIQRNKVRTRSVAELVNFYYLWKKTEEHDIFANRTKLKKKKNGPLYPGFTNIMDMFLDEQESYCCYSEKWEEYF
ncbi:hypothetical protein B7P43_G00456 [Cryptotermes secundus]|uniref:Uncharacterized protein n=1 Tax=Cryptotermes secundus TaxID=105785 RepID=A0A2J7R8M1_9NEOP|nr:hypothetical protein B7P43_G00456 [Cryptotermes secundus]